MRVLAFDPGVGFMGWALLEVSPPKELITVLDSGTLVGNRYLKHFSKELRKTFKDNFLILQAYKEVVSDLVKNSSPDIVVSEGAFAHLHIQAAFSLVRCIHLIREVSFTYLKKDVAIVAPMLTKKTLTGNNQAKKDEIQAAVINHKDIKTSKDLSSYTEHTYDAIGHGYHYIQTVLHPDVYSLRAKKKPKKKKK